MYSVNLATSDFVIADASGKNSEGNYKYSYHLVIRPAAGPGIVAKKQQLAELLMLCLQPKYKVKDLKNPALGKDIIDPSVYRTNYDFRMIYQSKKGGERPLRPLTHLDAPLDQYMLDYLPSDVQHLESRLPIGHLHPPLPTQLVLRDPPNDVAGASNNNSRRPSCSHSSSTNTCNKSSNSSSHKIKGVKSNHSACDNMFSFLTREGAMWLVEQVLRAADIPAVMFVPLSCPTRTLPTQTTQTERQFQSGCPKRDQTPRGAPRPRRQQLPASC
jgi:hypothetical protein